MVKQWWLIIATLTLFPSVVFSAPKLELVFEKHSVELGQALRAQLHGIDLAQSLSHINLTPLEHDFGVVIEEYISDAEQDSSVNHSQQTLLLELFPRRTGNLAVPSLSFGEAYTGTTEVSVQEATDGIKAISISHHISASDLWERQQFIVQVEVQTAQRFARLEIENSDITGMKVTPLKATREWVQTESMRGSILRTGWIMFPLVSGKHNLKLPPIMLQLHGVVERRFYLPQISVNIKTLPPYIPPTIPVGKVELRSRVPDKFLLISGNLFNWNISLRSDALAPQWLPAVLRQIKSNDSIVFSAANSKRSLETAFDGIHGQVVHNIPFKARSSGLVTLPAIRIQYFDPISGRLATVIQKSKSMAAISPAWLTFIVIIVISVFIAGAWILISKLKDYSKRRHKMNATLAEIDKSSDVIALRKALKHYANANGWPENKSLSVWLNHWQTKYQHNDKLIHCMQHLSNACYSKQPSYDFDGMRLAFLELLSSPKKLVIPKNRLFRRKVYNDPIQYP